MSFSFAAGAYFYYYIIYQLFRWRCLHLATQHYKMYNYHTPSYLPDMQGQVTRPCLQFYVVKNLNLVI